MAEPPSSEIPPPLSDQQWLAALIASSDDAIISKELNSVIRSWNDGATRLFGYTAAEMIGRPVTLLIPAGRQDEEPRILELIRQGRRIEHYETVRQRKDGSLVDVSITVSPIKDADGHIVGASKIARDISDRKRAEVALRRSEERFSLLANHAPVGIFLSDDGGRCVFVNEEWCRMSGLTLEQAQGDGWANAVHPDDRERVLAGWHQAVATHAASTSEFRFLRPDGSIVWLHGHAVQVEDGASRSYLGSCINITARKQAELQAAFLSGLRDQLEGLGDPDQIMDVAQAALATHLQADRCYFFEIIPSENLAIVRRDWRTPGFPSTTGHHRLADFGSPEFLALLAQPRNGIADVLTHPVTRSRTAGYTALNMRGLATSTFSKDGRRTLSLAVGTARPRAWTEPELDLLENVTARVWPAIERARTEQALRESERLYRAIGESINYGVWVCDADGRNIYASESFLRLVGVTQEQCSNLGWADLLHPDDVEATKSAWLECAREGRFWERKHRFRGADGAWHPVLARGVPVRDQLGHIHRWVGINLDISAMETAQEVAQKRLTELEKVNAEQRRTETMLRESETRWRQLAEAMPHLVWTCRADGQCDYLSPQWLRYTGASEVEQLGDGWLDVVHVDDRDRVTRDWRESVARRAVLDNEFRIRGADGKYRWFKTRAVPILDRKGNIVKWYGSNTDIDEFRRIEQAIRESERQLRLVTDHAPIFLAHLDRDHRFKFVNRTYAERQGLAVEDIIGRRVPEITGEEAYITFRERMDECLQGGHRVEFEQEIPYATLGRRWVHVIYEPERTADGEVVGLVAVIVDITARKQVEFELERTRDDALAASRAKDDFFAALSHELRTPLSPVLLMASDAANNPSLPREIREDFETIRANISLEARLIDDLLDLTRIARGKMSLEKHPVDIHAVLRDALANLRAEFAGKRLDLDLTDATPPPLVLGDPVRLQQVLWNLLKNAAKFTRSDGHIRVRTRVPAGKKFLEIEITDNGIGLTSGELAHLFEPFAQGEHASHHGPHRFGGLGLGLAISRNLVQMHEGRLQAQSPGRDQGATFLVELPLAPAPGSSSPAAPVEGTQPAGAAAAAPTSRVLLVEDHASTRAAVQRLLSRRGMAVAVAASVNEALVVAAREPFDFVVSDVGLPDGDGYQLFGELRRLRPGVQGIAMSGYGMEEDLQRSRTAGFSAHLVKPVSIAALEKALAQLKRPAT